MTSQLKKLRRNGAGEKEIVRLRVIERALFLGRKCPGDELLIERNRLIKRFTRLMDEFEQTNPREFLLGLRNHRAGYNAERDGASAVMQLIDDIDRLAEREVRELLGEGQDMAGRDREDPKLGNAGESGLPCGTGTDSPAALTAEPAPVVRCRCGAPFVMHTAFAACPDGSGTWEATT